MSESKPDLQTNLQSDLQEKKLAKATAPAFMPSSADKSVRSFNIGDFAIPTRKQHDWRFTPVERLSEFFEIFEPSKTTKADVSYYDGSRIESEKVSVSEVPIGAEETAIVGKPSDRVSAVAWNTAKTSTRIDILSSVDKPILISVKGNGSEESELKPDSLHFAIIARDNVRADVILEHTGSAVLAEGVEIIAGKNCKLSVTSIQEWDENSKHAGNHRLRIGENSFVRHSMVTLGADTVRIRVDQDFDGPHASSDMLGIYFADPGKHCEHMTMVDHNYPHCVSRVVYKGALDGKDAHAAWVGNALIEPEAHGTDSYELNRNLILTPGASADSEPNLEIENGNIVGAGHASSVGKFDEDALFYLQSRGISGQEAKKLVVRGFFAELIEQIGLPQLTERLANAIENRLDRYETDGINAAGSETGKNSVESIKEG